jgi:hypothetical protein
MKAKELAELLMQYPDFEVTTTVSDPDNSEYGMNFRKFKAIGIGDIGHSSKVIQIDFEET